MSQHSRNPLVGWRGLLTSVSKCSQQARICMRFADPDRDLTAGPSSSNQMLSNCILNQFGIVLDIKHFHDAVLVKCDGSGRNV